MATAIMDDRVEKVILVDHEDQPVGTAGKLPAHAAGLLHRAFSVFLFDAEGRLLLQRRAASKYHSAGLWANSCCGHPRPGEAIATAAVRRTEEELGVRCDLRPVGTHLYRADVGSGLIEWEFVHLFVGDVPPGAALEPTPQEVQDIAWCLPADIQSGCATDPGAYSAWLREYAAQPWFVDLGDGARAPVLG